MAYVCTTQTLDNDEMCWQVYPVCQGGGGHQHLHGTTEVLLFHYDTIISRQTAVVVGNPSAQQPRQLGVPHLRYALHTGTVGSPLTLGQVLLVPNLPHQIGRESLRALLAGAEN